jgi:hypothetical protein
MTDRTKLGGIMIPNFFGKIGGKEVATARLSPLRSEEMLNTLTQQGQTGEHHSRIESKCGRQHLSAQLRE